MGILNALPEVAMAKGAMNAVKAGVGAALPNRVQQQPNRNISGAQFPKPGGMQGGAGDLASQATRLSAQATNLGNQTKKMGSGVLPGAKRVKMPQVGGGMNPGAKRVKMPKMPQVVDEMKPGMKMPRVSPTEL